MSASRTIAPAVSTGTNWRELASRAGDGLEVTLLWSKSADRIKVTVADARLDAHFELDVAGADALSAFDHPFAYAARRGICFGDALIVSDASATAELTTRES